jgi:hypothetical protein
MAREKGRERERVRENRKKSMQFYLVDPFPSASSCLWSKFDIVATSMFTESSVATEQLGITCECVRTTPSITQRGF